MDTFSLRANMPNVTTSWDDGDILDIRVSELLTQYGLTGTFYITKNYRSERLSEGAIQNIAKHHEIGAHTLTHPDLRTLPTETLTEEISGSKKWLEEILGSEVTMFCYPKGQYNEATTTAVKNAGFIGARTTELGSTSLPQNVFKMHTTIQVYPFPFRKIDSRKYYFGKLFEPFRQRAAGLRKLGVPTLSMYSWLSMAKATFDVTIRNGGVFHLWGHSWEIEKYDMWKDFEGLLQYISSQKNCKHVTNSRLISTNE